MEKEFVMVNGKKYYVENDSLALCELKITDIAQIKGLDDLNNLRYLDLGANQIREIKGLETLTELEILDLYDNQIEEIQGLESLKNLQTLYLRENPIRADERHLFEKKAQDIVRYCQEKARMTNDLKNDVESERKAGKRRYERDLR